MLDLSKYERYIIVFLSLALLAGLGIKYKRTLNSRPELEVVPAELERLKPDDYIGKVDINHSGREELMLLNGIGPELADKIVEYRRKNGSFAAKEDIKNVKGIGDEKFRRIEDSITTR